MLSFIDFRLNVDGRANKKIELLSGDKTEFFLLREGADADERVIVNNYSSYDDSFILWSYAQGTWILIAETPQLLCYENSKGNGVINSKYYRFRYKTERNMEYLEGFSKYLSCIAIYSLSGHKHKVFFQRQSWDLVVSIYDADDTNNKGIPSTEKEYLNYDYVRPLVDYKNSQGPDESAARIKKIKSLYEQGILTKEEYEKIIQEVIKQM